MTNNHETLKTRQPTLPEVIQAWALALAQQTNEVIVRGILWGESPYGQKPRGSVLDRPVPTPEQRKKRFKERMKRQKS